MTILLKQLFAFFKLLNSDTGTNSLAAGLACGVILGFAPLLSLQALLLLVIVFFFRIQLGAAFISAFFFKLVAFLIDPLSDSLGRSILENPGLRSLFKTLYNMPIVPLTRFNNSIVMGSAIVSVILVIPLFFVFKKLIVTYRTQIVERFKKSKLWKAWVGTKIHGMYVTYTKLY
jgi:uncharacterized protein (TIGR03546 family)